MTDSDLTPLLGECERTLMGAAGTRRRLRKTTKPGDESRERYLQAARESIDRAMAPVRSIIGGLRWYPRPAREERQLRDISKRLGAERRRIKKMQRG